MNQPPAPTAPSYQGINNRAAAMPAGAYVSSVPVAAPVQHAMLAVPAPPLYADALSCLVAVPGLYVRERINLLEIMTGFETENTFDASLWNPEGHLPHEPEQGKGAPAFVMKEVSDCCQRQFCGPRRAFSIAMVPSTPMLATYRPDLTSRASMFAHPDALIFNRPFSWACCCFCRPKVHLAHNTLGRFATITNPCRCCRYEFDVHAAAVGDGDETPVSPTVAGENGAKWYVVSGSMCQPGAICFCPPCCCGGACSRIVLHVYDASDTELKKPIGEVARVFPGWIVSAVSQASTYTIAFPQGSHEHGLRRAALAAAMLLMNYLFAEKKKSRDDGLAAGGNGVGAGDYGSSSY